MHLADLKFSRGKIISSAQIISSLFPCGVTTNEGFYEPRRRNRMSRTAEALITLPNLSIDFSLGENRGAPTSLVVAHSRRDFRSKSLSRDATHPLSFRNYFFLFSVFFFAIEHTYSFSLRQRILARRVFPAQAEERPRW